MSASTIDARRDEIQRMLLILKAIRDGVAPELEDPTVLSLQLGEALFPSVCILVNDETENYPGCLAALGLLRTIRVMTKLQLVPTDEDAMNEMLVQSCRKGSFFCAT
jgi:hypothetical protein